jgi:hypothetical protein
LLVSSLMIFTLSWFLSPVRLVLTVRVLRPFVMCLVFTSVVLNAEDA